jgi:hypothetical protein
MLKEKVIVYIGPSLSLEKARAIEPDLIYKTPAKQSDIVSDIENENPTHLILIDGEFHQNLSVWVKEIVYALHKGLKVYGSSSMGALRAADLERCGMVGYGQIYEWYRDGIIDDDSEVAVSYSEDYSKATVPLVNIRASVKDEDGLNRILELSRGIHYSSRWAESLKVLFKKNGIKPFKIIDQKAIDAEGLLRNFRSLKTDSPIPGPESLTTLFRAQHERDRKVDGVSIQHIESHAALSLDNIQEEIWNAGNRSIALLACNYIDVRVSRDDLAIEFSRLMKRLEIKDKEELLKWIDDNHLNQDSFKEFLTDNARIRKLQGAFLSTRTCRRTTKPMLDHLRTFGRYSKLGKSASRLSEEKMVLDSIKSVSVGDVRTDGSLEDFIREAGFSTLPELLIAIEREKE